MLFYIRGLMDAKQASQNQIKNMIDKYRNSIKFIEYEIKKVTEIEDINAAGIFLTPALAIDGELKVVGKVPSSEEIKKWL